MPCALLAFVCLAARVGLHASSTPDPCCFGTTSTTTTQYLYYPPYYSGRLLCFSSVFFSSHLSLIICRILLPWRLSRLCLACQVSHQIVTRYTIVFSLALQSDPVLSRHSTLLPLNFLPNSLAIFAARVAWHSGLPPASETTPVSTTSGQGASVAVSLDYLPSEAPFAQSVILSSGSPITW